MSKIQIVCDRCGAIAIVPVRQAHEARRILEARNWTSKDVSGPAGAKKDDYCPDCSH